MKVSLRCAIAALTLTFSVFAQTYDGNDNTTDQNSATVVINDVADEISITITVGSKTYLIEGDIDPSDDTFDGTVKIDGVFEEYISGAIDFTNKGDSDEKILVSFMGPPSGLTPAPGETGYEITADIQ